MKVLLLSWNFRPVRGGIEYVVENLFDRLRGRGHTVELVTAWAEGSGVEANVHRAATRGLKAYVKHSLMRGWRLCRGSVPDVILCGSLVAAPAGYALSRAFRRPFAVLVHGSDVLRKGWVYQRAIRFLLKRATRVAANSTPTRLLLEQMGIDGEKVDVIHPGVRIEDFEDGGNRAGYEGRRVLLSVGRLIRRKGLVELVEHVMPRLVREHPDVLLLIVGEDATKSLVHSERMRDRIEAKVAEMGLGEHVKLLGEVPQEELVGLYRRADVFVMPGLDLRGDVEGFGIVMLEAALGGLPTVGTRVGGVPEAVEDGRTGLLVRAGDWEGFREAVGRLLKDEELRRRLGTAGEKRARERFSWDVIVGEYERMLERCMG